MEAQEKLEESNAELTRMNKEKNAFLGMVSHDIRQPLGNIMLSCELIIEDNRDTLTSQQVQLVQAVHSSAVLMHTLVDDLLHVSKLDFGRVSVELDRRAVDVMQLINKTVMMNALLASKKNISLTVRRRPKNNVKNNESAQNSVDQEDYNLPITCYIDPVKIEQTLNNLISNAIKFSYSGSTVEVCLEKQQDNAEIRVIDHGQGIPNGDLGHLFKPFQRLSVRPTAGEASTGLGLCIVKKIVEAHEGKIKLESKEGEGTTVIVLLPLLTSSSPCDTTPATKLMVKETTKPLRILIAEDNTLNQQLLTQVLRRRHHNVQIASDGVEAIEMYTKEGGCFDVLLLDEEMPRMKGTEVAQTIRRRERDNKETSKLPIISISGHLSSEDDQDSRLYGIDYCLPKPFQVEELIRIVEGCAGKECK
jgi:light-regulated signal transduction histidine kinase (bacteriophytochrome)/CheY-like chemotaxis protein